MSSRAKTRARRRRRHLSKGVVFLLFAIAAPGTAGQPVQRFTPQSPSPFAMAKAERLLRDKLPCLGCHTLNGEGGRSGPSLSNLAVSRSPDYIYAMIRDPQRTLPGTAMPRVPMTEATLDLIASYLVQREPSKEPAAPVPPPAAPPRHEDASALYARLCATCHGSTGKGDGKNAPFLPVRPAAHTDAALMSIRPDDTLFDTIYGGGYIMNKSHLMPAYGQTLDRQQIWSLVRYLRTLCHCEGPTWSRDGR